MQTFLPYADLSRSAAVLDNKRLGKQRVEAKQILLVLGRGGGPWFNHPAVRQWLGCEYWLREYAMFICGEWLSRGYNDTVLGGLKRQRYQKSPKPWWLGLRVYHLSHQSNLMRKAPEWYSQYWSTAPDMDYFWPSRFERR